MSDNVNHPNHYNAHGKIECIEAIEVACADLVGVEAFCTANAIKYLWRWKKKNGHEDLRKAKWYIDRILGETDKQVSERLAEQVRAEFPKKKDALHRCSRCTKAMQTFMTDEFGLCAECRTAAAGAGR